MSASVETRSRVPAGLPTGDRFTGQPLDFASVAKDFDAIWLTERGQHATHDPRPDSLYPGLHLYGWDLESVLVLGPDAVKAADEPPRMDVA